MIKVSIIGSGNVAQHLIAAFAENDTIALVEVCARNPESVSGLIPKSKIVARPQDLGVADLYIIAVSDSAIAEVSRQLEFSDRLVVHTSGSVAMEAADPKNRRGVFYPLQTFTKGKPVLFREIPLCLEAENPDDFKLLEQVGKTISDHIYAISSAQRKALHVAAVFVSNFTNHMYHIGEQICDANGIPFDILKPLITETADKVMTLSPAKAQTGPAQRRDANTIAAHLEFLQDENLKKIYQTLTQSITDGQKL
jgi:predicted short-subunit dehydrogenase-like oxidoreductase (DUF2520 family)